MCSAAEKISRSLLCFTVQNTSEAQKNPTASFKKPFGKFNLSRQSEGHLLCLQPSGLVMGIAKHYTYGP